MKLIYFIKLKNIITNMEEINLDLNNLFNLSYNFEGLKILLKSIAKKQDGMMEKIKELERRPINNFQKYDEKPIQINNKNKEEEIIHTLKDDNEVWHLMLH